MAEIVEVHVVSQTGGPPERVIADTTAGLEVVGHGGGSGEDGVFHRLPHSVGGYGGAFFSGEGLRLDREYIDLALSTGKIQ